MADLKVTLSLLTGKFDQGLATATKSIQRFQSNVNKAGRQIVNSLNFTGINTTALLNPYTAAAAAIGGVVTSVISNQVKFEKSMDNFQAILGVSAREMEYFSQEAIRMGSATTQTASQVAEAYTMIAARLPQLLKSKEGLVQVTEAAIILAEAAGITVDEAGKALADSINQTGASAYEASRYINVLAAGSRNGAGDITYLNTALEKFGSIGSTVGMSFEQLVASIETVAPKITDASSAGIYLRQVLLTLEKQNDEGLRPSVVGISQALENLAAKQLTVAEYAQMFDKRAVITAMTLVEQRNKFNELTNAVTGTNTAYEQAELRTDNVKGAITRLSSAWERFTLSVSNSTGALQGFLDTLATVLNTITDGFANNNAAESAQINTKYDIQAINGIIENIVKYKINPETGNNYTNKEAAQQLKGNYKYHFPELETIDNKVEESRNKAILSYLDDIINRQEKINQNNTEVEDSNEAQIEQLKRQLQLTTNNVEKAAILAQIKELGGNVSDIKTTKISIKEEAPSGSIAELKNKISDLKKQFENATNDGMRAGLMAAIAEAETQLKMMQLRASKMDLLSSKSIQIEAKNPLEGLDTSDLDPFRDTEVFKKDNSTLDYLTTIGSLMNNIAGATNNSTAAWMNYFSSILSGTAALLPLLASVFEIKAMEGIASQSKLPWPMNLIAMAATAAGLIASIANIPKFANGGIFTGNSFIGDMNIARVNSGEMILNNRQQRNLFNLLNGNGGITNDNVKEIKLKIEGRDLVSVINSENFRTSKFK